MAKRNYLVSYRFNVVNYFLLTHSPLLGSRLCVQDHDRSYTTPVGRENSCLLHKLTYNVYGTEGLLGSRIHVTFLSLVEKDVVKYKEHVAVQVFGLLYMVFQLL